MLASTAMQVQQLAVHAMLASTAMQVQQLAQIVMRVSTVILAHPRAVPVRSESRAV